MSLRTFEAFINIVAGVCYLVVGVLLLFSAHALDARVFEALVVVALANLMVRAGE